MVEVFLLAATIILLLIFIFVVLLSDIAWSRLLLASSNICFAIFICSLVFETSLSNSFSFVSNLLHFFCTVFSEAFPFFFLFSSSFSLSFCLLLTYFPSSSCFFMQCTNDEFSLQLHMYLLIRSRHDLAFFFKSSEIHRSFIRQQCSFIGQCVFFVWKISLTICITILDRQKAFNHLIRNKFHDKERKCPQRSLWYLFWELDQLLLLR